jgi:hypothetical protein
MAHKETHRWVSRKDIALTFYDQMIAELEYVSSAIVYLPDGKECAHWIHKRINKLLEEKAKCRLK